MAISASQTDGLEVLEHERLLRAEAEAINRVSLGLTAELNLQRLLQKVTDAGTDLTGAKFGAFFYNTTNQAGEAYILYTLSGAPRESFEKFGLPRVTPLFESTFRGDGITRLDDVLKDPRYGKNPPFSGMPKGHLSVRSYLAVPVVARDGKVLGGLFFGHPKVGVFTDHSVRIARGISNQAAVAIENAKTHEQALSEIRERVRAEGALRESESLHRQLVQGLRAAVYTCDGRGRLQLYNRAAVELWGREPRADEAWHESLRLLNPDGTPLDLELCSMAVALKEGRTVTDQEVIIERPDGTRRIVIPHPEPLRDSAGNVVGAVNMLVDVTEQKRAQQELAETHRDLEQKVAALTRLHELSMSLLSSSDLDANLRAILETTIDLCGADFGLLAIYDPESACLRARASVGFRAEILEEIGRLISGSNAGPCGMAFTTRERVEVASVMSDPRFLDYRNVAQEVGFQSVHVTPVLTRSGEILGVLSVHFRTHHVSTQSERQLADICARYAADTIETIRNRSALQESETRFRSFADAAPAILWTTAPNGACNFVSGGWCEFTGQDPQAVLGWGWLEAIHPEDRQKTRDFFVAANERQEPFAMDYRLRRCDGVYRWIASVGRPRFGVGRTYEGYVGSLIDVTDRKQAEEALKDAKNVAEAASRSKDRFLAVLSHELRTPLAPVLMAAAAIEEDSEVSPRLKEDVAMIKRNVELEAKLIDDLLDLSRVTSGKLKLQPVALDVNAAISHVCEICQAQVVEKNIRVICDLAENLPRVSADPSRIQQVLWNILKNAVKFTPEGGVIHIRSATLDGKVSVQIRDSGIGIQPQLLPKIFDMFEQGDARITQQFGGLGLGLAISHAIVELHHGSLRAESEGPHKGATFTLELPQETFPTICLTEVSEVRDMQPERKLRLLVVEDHLDTAKVIQRMLQLWGYAVKIAHSVEEAKELAEQETFDILLSDVGLPDASGYDLMRFIKQRHGIKGLAMSGYGMDEDIRKALDAGFSDHLVKPVNLNQLKQAITRVVESP